MIKVAEGQLALFSIPTAEQPKRRAKNHLAEPLTREQQREYAKMYADNIGLIKYFANKLCMKYRHCMASEDIDSCVDIAFIKTCRAWNPEKGKFSTIFWCFAHGECLHYLRGSNWSIKATHKVRLLGNNARRLMDLGWDTVAVCRELSCSKDDLKDALMATSGVAHDVRGFDLHMCPRMTPWEYVEAMEDGNMPEAS